MGKHQDKIAAALKWRQDNMPKGTGFKKPGSMNKKKTGYRSYTSKEAARIVSK